MSSHSPQIRNLDQGLDWEQLCGSGPAWGLPPVGRAPCRTPRQLWLPAWPGGVGPSAAFILQTREPGRAGGAGRTRSVSLAPAWQRLWGGGGRGGVVGRGVPCSLSPRGAGQFEELALPCLSALGRPRMASGIPAKSPGGRFGARPPLAWVRASACCGAAAGGAAVSPHPPSSARRISQGCTGVSLGTRCRSRGLDSEGHPEGCSWVALVVGRSVSSRHPWGLPGAAQPFEASPGHRCLSGPWLCS